VKSILSKKPLACDDIQTLDDARRELQRIRKLADNFKQNQILTTAATAKKGKRVAIHQEENISDYVKQDVPKNEDIRRLLHAAIKANVLFESNTEAELQRLIDVFVPCSAGAGDVVIEQDNRGDTYFVVEEGELSITVRMGPEERVKVGNYHGGDSFGELALIYGSPRAATITATEPCKMWRMKRGWYRGVVGQHRKGMHKEKVEFLPKVNVNENKFGEMFTKDQIDSMAQLLQQQYFSVGDTILREGEAGNTFYIIQSGEVNIFNQQVGDKPIAKLGKEEFFGEQALLSDDVRTATVVAARCAVVMEPLLSIAPVSQCRILPRSFSSLRNIPH
jgi:CRP-like cAMP-binding protein